MTTRLTRPQRKARTRDEILAAARGVFLGRGFHGTTLDEIAEEAGYTKGAVYSNFAGKDDLFLAILDERFEWRTSESLAAAREAESLDDALRANARLYAEAARHEPAWEPLLVEYWTHASRSPATRKAAAARHDAVLDVVAQLLLELAQRFEIEWKVAPREVARVGGAFARGMALERLLDPTASPLDRFEKQFLELIRTYLRPNGKGGSAE
jgi:AcrR family transcriptional regulator